MATKGYGVTGSWDTATSTPPAAGQPTPSAELDAYRQRLNTTSTHVDPNDPLVYMGTRPRGAGGLSNVGRTTPIVRPYSDVLGDMYRWDQQQLRGFQERAYKAGLYGSADRTDIAWGAIDDDTYRAWTSVVTNAARSRAAGTDRTPMDILDQMAAAYPSGPPSARSGPKQTIRVSNPADIRRVARLWSTENLGSGNLDPAVGGRIVAGFQAEQRRAQSAAYAGGTSTDPPSLETYITDFFKNTDPERYDARKVINGLRRVHDMLAGGTAPSSTA